MEKRLYLSKMAAFIRICTTSLYRTLIEFLYFVLVLPHQPLAPMDSFVSYSHIDNSSPGDWVTSFHNDLTNTLAAVSGTQKVLFLDLRDNDGITITEKIRDGLKATETMCLVFSPSYFQSNWCKNELQYFVDECNKDEFKVVIAERLPLDEGEEQPHTEFLLDNHKIEFHHNDIPLVTGEKVYNERMYKLARLLKKAITHQEEMNIGDWVRATSNNLTQDSFLVQLKNEMEEDQIKVKNFRLNNPLYEFDSKIYLLMVDRVVQEPENDEYLNDLERFLKNWERTAERKCIVWLSPESGKHIGSISSVTNLLKNYEGNVDFDFVVNSFEELKLTVKENARLLYG